MKSIVKKEEKKQKAKKKKCIFCGSPASYSIKGIENNTYCRECALDAFKYLNYLEKLEVE